MARIFRIKNRFLRWMAGLVALGIDAISGLIKRNVVIVVILVFALVAVLLAGIGVVAYWLLALIGISDVRFLNPFSGFEGKITLGFLAILAGCVLGRIVWLIVKIPPKAKKFGDRYFNSIGDKKQIG